MTESLANLEKKLNYRFINSDLLERALTHSSFAREKITQLDNRCQADNEQLEFLGDAVLGFVISQELFHRFPVYNEGQLSKLKAYFVSARHLIRAAHALDLGKYLLLGKGEEKSGGRAKKALLVDALEALLAALYLDAGIDEARAFILREILEPELKALEQQGERILAVTDNKSRLLEMAQAQGRTQPAYFVVQEQGPEHKKIFTVEARIHARNRSEAEFIGYGQGSTKKKAEQTAAREALRFLEGLKPGKNEQNE